jgi:hypothetical protein
VIELVDCASGILQSESPPALVVCAAAFMKVVVKNIAHELIQNKRGIYQKVRKGSEAKIKEEMNQLNILVLYKEREVDVGAGQ